MSEEHRYQLHPGTCPDCQTDLPADEFTWESAEQLRVNMNCTACGWHGWMLMESVDV